MGLVKSAFVEPARVFPLKHLRPEIPAYAVVALVAQNGRHQQHAGGHRQADQTDAAQRPDDEQQRVAGQKRHHHQAGLDEHDGKQQGVDPCAVGLYKDLQMPVHMQNEVDQKSK